MKIREEAPREAKARGRTSHHHGRVGCHRLTVVGPSLVVVNFSSWLFVFYAF